MGKINILDFQVANLIAAGEVVDRPASVIKELLENAIDAEAKVVTVETKKGGSAFMRVTDDGVGMSRDDVPVCVKRHATSKIRTERDLDGILTLGFRGEALAAIAAVSKMRIMTKTKDSDMGTIMRCENGTVLEINETGCPNGTTVIVEELFASVPARRKFLKRDLVETMAISAVVEKIALSHPEISIRLICDGNTKFASVGDGSLKNTVYSVLGREFSSKLIEVDCLTEGVGVNGYIGSPDNIRGNRNLQNFFINGRFVKSKTIQAALEQAFESYIPSDRFPSCILYLQIHPAYVDVNVHPAKLEVKFSNEQTIFNAVYCAVRNALTHNVSRPKMRFGDKNTPDIEFAEDPEKLSSDIKLQNAFVPIKERGDNTKPTSLPELPELPETVPVPSVPDSLTETELRVTEDNPPEGLHMTSDGSKPEIPDKPEDAPLVREIPDLIQQIPETPENKPDTKTIPAKYDHSKVSPKTGVKEISVPISDTIEETEVPPEQNIASKPPKYKIIGELFNTYITVELFDRVLIIDKHAAHERIIFEEMRRTHSSGKIFAQMALVPVELKLSPEEYAALIEYRGDISATGFEFETQSDGQTVRIVQYPADFDIRYIGEILLTMADRLAKGSGSAEITRQQNYEKAMYQASCKAAIKAGEINAPEQIRWLCDKLLVLPDIKYCPHGRPVAMELTRTEIERQFKRIK